VLNVGLMSSERADWNTPACVLELVREVFGGRVPFDPCSNATSIVNARRSLSLEAGQDGLVYDWSRHGSVYVNPPYGREIGRWIEKCAAEGCIDGAEIIALVPARTDAKWFQRCFYASAICFWRGRLRFLGAPSSAPFPSAVVYWGGAVARFADVFGRVGHVVLP
jgi:hypothetical protein